jgi:hypothetical protein
VRSTRRPPTSARSHGAGGGAGANPGKSAVLAAGDAASPRSSDLHFVQLAQRRDDPLARSPRRAHRLAQMPVAVTDAARLLVFPPQEHAGSIAGTAAANKGVFGTTLTWRTRPSRQRYVPAGSSPLKLFSPTARTDELGLDQVLPNRSDQNIRRLKNRFQKKGERLSTDPLG